MKTILLKDVLMQIIVTVFVEQDSSLHIFIIVLCFCVFISASVWCILVFFQAHIVYFRETEVATLMLYVV